MKVALRYCKYANEFTSKNGEKMEMPFDTSRQNSQDK